MKLHRGAAVLAAALFANVLYPVVASATPVTFSQIRGRTDWCSAGIGGVGAAGTGTINLSCVTGTVTKAFLFWHGMDFYDGVENGPVSAKYDNQKILVNSQKVTGVSIGDATTNCWGPGSSRAFRADITSLVTGNGPYALSGLASKHGHNANGASLIVFFDDGNLMNDRDVAIFNGNDSLFADGFPGETDNWAATMPGILYSTGGVNVQLHVADGQGNHPVFGTGAIDVSTTFSTSGGTQNFPDSGHYDGASTPSAGNSRTTAHGIPGSLWDIHTFGLTTPFPAPGDYTLQLNSTNLVVAEDCLGLVVAVVDTPIGALTNTDCPTTHRKGACTTMNQADFSLDEDPTADKKDKISFSASKNVTGVNFGNPTAAGKTDNFLCVYRGDTDQLIMKLEVENGGFKDNGKEKWKLNPKTGLAVFGDPEKEEDGVGSIKLKPSEKPDKASVNWKGSSTSLPDPTGGLPANNTPLIVQNLTSDAGCIEAEFSAQQVTTRGKNVKGRKR